MSINRSDILSGKVIYPIEELARDFKDFIYQYKKDDISYSDEERRIFFKKMFLFVLFSSEYKPISLISKVLGLPEDKVKEGQDLFKDWIELAISVQMKQFLDIMKNHWVNESMVLKILNNNLHKFLRSLFPEDYDNQS